MKVESYPRAAVSWYLNGKELVPSKEFGVDHLEDGTSILTLSEVFPDDAGELMCEAQNDKGVATSITMLNVTGEYWRFFLHSKFTFLNLSFFNKVTALYKRGAV